MYEVQPSAPPMQTMMGHTSALLNQMLSSLGRSTAGILGAAEGAACVRRGSVRRGARAARGASVYPQLLEGRCEAENRVDTSSGRVYSQPRRSADQSIGEAGGEIEIAN